MMFDAARLGVWSAERAFAVEQDQVAAYARATNDPDPMHTEGRLATPVFAVVPLFATGVVPDALDAMVPPQLALVAVHGEHDIVFHAPVTVGRTLFVRARPIGIEVKRSGTVLVLHAQTRDQDGGAVNEQYLTLFYRGASRGVSLGEAAPGHRLPEGVRDAGQVLSATQTVDHDQTHRYAAASGDHMPIHLDDDVARSGGLPGIIVHGLCTMAMAGHVVVQGVCGGDARRLKRLAVRLSAVVLPGQELTTTVWSVRSADGADTVHFDVVDRAGTLVVTDGLARVTGSPADA